MPEFGKYSIIHQIGTGGMAEVFLAKSYGAEGLEKRLVIKRILPDYANRPKFVSMFIDEAKVAVSLNHPNIVQVYEFGKVATDYYLAMEFVDGTDLGHVANALKKAGTRLAFGEVAYVGIEVAKALDYAHRKTDEYGRALSIVHRDVSPQNVLISWDGSVKLLDFGIAKARNTAAERSGVVKGKVSYMAPEQALGDPVDGRTDVFSLGAVLYELLAGRAPFPKGKPEEVLQLVRAGVVPELHTFRDDLPPELTRIVMKAVSPKQESRWDTARELQVALTRFLFSQTEIHDAATVSDRLAGLRAIIDAEPPPDTAAAPRATLVAARTQTNPDTLPESRAGGSGDYHTHDTQNRYSHTGKTGTPTPSGLGSFRERRDTFIIVGELMGLQELRSAVSDERWRQVLFDYIHIVQAVGYKNQCAVDRVDERGFILLAGVPFSSENDAETAIRVGRDLIEAVEAMNVNLIQPLHLSVGVGTGGLVLERARYGEEERFTWLAEGDSWDVARDLSGEAMVGEILVDEACYGLTRRTYRHTALGEADSTLNITCYRVEGAKSHRERLLERRNSFTTLHGRDFELRLLRQSFQAAKRKNTVQTLVFEGEAGVGKATIVEEFVSGLAPDRVHVVRAQCSAELRDRPFAPMKELLADLLQVEESGDIRKLRTELERAVMSLTGSYDEEERLYILHAVGLLFNIKFPGNLVDSLDSSRRRARMFLSLRRLLGAAAQRGAAVLVVNDVHIADQSSGEFLLEMARQPRKRPILCILTLEAGDIDQNPVWNVLKEIDGVVVTHVGDLPPHSARLLIQDLFPAPLHRDLLELVVERSGGNPLFIKEISEALQEGGMLVERDGQLSLADAAAELRLPRTVEGIVAGRVNALPLGPKMVLLKACIIGREMGKADLQAVFGELPVNELDYLVNRGIMKRIVDGDGEERYRVRKGLTHKVAQKALLEEERAEIHARLAEHMIARDLSALGPDLATVAKHLEAAGEPEDAGQFFLLAAGEAATSSGLVEALALVKRSMVLLEDDSEFRFSALDLEERLLKDLGMLAEREATLDRLTEYVGRHGPAELRVAVLVRQARYEFDMGRLDEAEVAVRSALAEADEINDQTGRASALTLLTSVLRNTGRFREAREACEEALEIYTDNPNPEGVATAANQLGILEHEDGRLTEALSCYDRAIEVAREAGYRAIEEMARINIGYTLVKLGELERAVQTYRSVLREILQLGHRRNEAALLANLGHAQILLGDFARAEHTLKRCIRLSKRNSDPTRQADGLLTLATAHLARGRQDEAAKGAKLGLKKATEAQNEYLICHGHLLSGELRLKRRHRGDLQGALDDAERVLQITGKKNHPFARARAHSLKSRVLARMDRAADALASAEAAYEVVRDGAVEGAQAVLYHHAVLMHQHERDDEARESISKAYARFCDKRDRIRNPKTRTVFCRLKPNARVVDLFGRLVGHESDKSAASAAPPKSGGDAKT